MPTSRQKIIVELTRECCSVSELIATTGLPKAVITRNLKTMTDNGELKREQIYKLVKSGFGKGIVSRKIWHYTLKEK